METVSNLTNLTPAQLLLCAGVIFLASLVRGFSGFALSALVMASLIAILPPIELLPICYLMEATASLMMVRGGIKHADMKIVWGLIIGAVIGLPIGFALTVSLPVDLTKTLALSIILILALMQFSKVSPKFLATRLGLYGTGVIAGMVTGIAHIGGMVVALYVLAREAPAKVMRASLVVYLFIGIFTSLFYQLSFGIMNVTALWRGAFAVPLVVAGVLLGSALFQPRFEQFYKKFCLVLLIGLAATGLVRQLI